MKSTATSHEPRAMSNQSIANPRGHDSADLPETADEPRYRRTTALCRQAARSSQRTAALATVERSECVAAPSAQRVECPECGKTFCGGSVVKEPPHDWSREHGCYLANRTLYCDHCHHLVKWIQATDDMGFNAGAAVGEPTITRDRRIIDQFLRDHPQAAGVMQ